MRKSSPNPYNANRAPVNKEVSFVDTCKDIAHSVARTTVRYFKNKFPNDKLYFLMGSDQANFFHRWQGAEELAKIAQIIFYPRSGIVVSEENIKKYNMELIKGSFYDYASSSIRNLNDLGLADEVLFYILEHELYFVKRVKEAYKDERLYNHALSVGKLCLKIAEAKKESALKIGLLSAGAKASDIDYLIYKMNHDGDWKAELGDDGNIKGLDDKLKGLKTQFPNQFESASQKKIEEKKLEKSDDDSKVTKEDFKKMGYKERTALFNENPDLYRNLANEK